MRWMMPMLMALFIDMFTLLVSLSLSGMVTGVGGLLQFIPGLGTIAGIVTWGAGIVLGIIITMCINLTAGVGLMFALFFTYHRSVSRLKVKIESIILRRMTIFFLGELIPIVNNLPLMTIGTALTIWHIHKDEKKAHEKTAGQSAYSEEEPEMQERLSLPQPHFSPQAYTQTQQKTQSPSRAPLLPGRFQDGINPPQRAPNDTNLARTAYAA